MGHIMAWHERIAQFFEAFIKFTARRWQCFAFAGNQYVFRTGGEGGWTARA